MIVVCHQPDFLPYLGYFDRLLKADVFVIMDNVQLVHPGWPTRNRIKGPSHPIWLSVPIVKRASSFQAILEARIDHTQPWQRQTTNTIRSHYRHSPHFETYFQELERLLTEEVDLLVDLNLRLLAFFFDALQIHIPTVVRASELGIAGKRNEFLANAVQAIGGDTYLSGGGAGDYLDVEHFHQRGIKVVIQDFRHPMYPQRYGPFLPDLSVVDLLLNCGPDSATILRNAARPSALPAGLRKPVQ